MGDVVCREWPWGDVVSDHMIVYYGMATINRVTFCSLVGEVSNTVGKYRVRSLLLDLLFIDGTRLEASKEGREKQYIPIPSRYSIIIVNSYWMKFDGINCYS